MSIQKFIKENVGLLGSNTYIAPDIPPKKLDGAIKSYAEEVDISHVVALKDSTVFSTGKEGCLFLGDAVYLKASFESKLKLSYEEIEEVKYWTTEANTRFGNTKTVEHIEVELKNGETYDLARSLLNVNFSGFADFINGLLQEGVKGKEFTNTSQITPLSEMSEEVKQKYVKIVSNFAYSDDQIIDVKEYTEIISLIVRIDITSESRLKLRGYMSSINNMEPTNTLLEQIRNEVEEGSFDILGQSLFKDIVYIFGQSGDIQLWKQNDFLLNLAILLSIKDDKANLIITAIQHDKDILKYRKNDSQIAKSVKDIAAKAAGVGVPMAAIYFTGSVAGLSAAGITSGLATMGFGGLLGFSSMFTGIGTLVLLGLGTYQGIKKVSGIGDVENNKQREFMLQAIIRNTQKSLSYLIEDINGITQQLTYEIQKSDKNSEKIEQLSNVLTMLTQGAQLNAIKQSESETEKVITKLPVKLDVNRLFGLTNKPSLEKVREFILSCYEEKSVPENNVEEVADKVAYQLKEGITLEEAENLYALFEQIEYNKFAQAAFASAKTKALGLFGERS